MLFFGLTTAGSFEIPNCAGLSAQMEADFAIAVRQLSDAVYRAAIARGDDLLARDALMSGAARNPSCATAGQAWEMATKVADDPAVAAGRRALEVLASQTRHNMPAARVPVAGILLGTGLLVVAGALLVIPTRMKG